MKNPNGRIFSIEVGPQDTVLNLKAIIQRIVGIPILLQNLLYCRLNLCNENRISDYNLDKESSQENPI